MNIRNLLFILAALALTGCANTMSVKSDDHRVVGAGAVRVAWLAPLRMEVDIDGRRYVGPWTTVHCTAETCGEAYSTATRSHRRHMYKGHATLTAEDGSTLECEGINHLLKVDGTCRGPNGRSFRIRGEDDAD